MKIEKNMKPKKKNQSSFSSWFLLLLLPWFHCFFSFFFFHLQNKIWKKVKKVWYLHVVNDGANNAHDDGTPSSPPMALHHNGVLLIKQTNHNHQPKNFKKMMTKGHHCWGASSSFSNKDVYCNKNKKMMMKSLNFAIVFYSKEQQPK